MKNKSFKIKLIILLIFSIISIVFVYNNQFLYKTPILKVTEVKNEEKDSSMFKETYYNQVIKGIIENGKYKNFRR